MPVMSTELMQLINKIIKPYINKLLTVAAGAAKGAILSMEKNDMPLSKKGGFSDDYLVLTALVRAKLYENFYTEYLQALIREGIMVRARQRSARAES